MKEIKKVNKTNLLWKGCTSALAGFPISFLLNLSILPFVFHWVEWNWLVGTLAIGIPYFGASVSRMFIIDYFWEKYNIQVDVGYYIKRLLNRQF